MNDLNRDLDKCIIIDNSPIAFCLNPENAVPIRSWYSDKKDEELYFLISILTQLAKAKSIKQVITTIISKITFENNTATYDWNLKHKKTLGSLWEKSGLGNDSYLENGDINKSDLR